MYDMNASKAELSQASEWWRSLSINQMKGFEKKYFPHWLQLPHDRMIHHMWKEEGKPEPQDLIPVV